MLCIGNSQPTEEYMVDAKDGSMVHAAQIGTIGNYVATELSCTYRAAAFQDAQDIEKSIERVNWNQAQYKPEKKTSEATFII